MSKKILKAIQAAMNAQGIFTLADVCQAYQQQNGSAIDAETVLDIITRLIASGYKITKVSQGCYAITLKQKQNPFTVLGIAPSATADEIKAAFRAKAKETHPDHGGDAEAFRTVHSAYEQALATQK